MQPQHETGILSDLLLNNVLFRDTNARLMQKSAPFIDGNRFIPVGI